MRKLAFALIMTGGIAVAQADVTSAFDSNSDGWSTATVAFPTTNILGTGSVTWNAGHIEATEFTTLPNDLFVLVAPAKFAGNKSSYYGGSASYRLSDATRDATPYPNLLLISGTTAIGYVTAGPSASGTDYSIPLTQTGWITSTNGVVSETLFKSVLSNLTAVAINADWTSNTVDVVTLDNVRFAQPVPEPATVALFGAGALGLLRRRTRSV